LICRITKTPEGMRAFAQVCRAIRFDFARQMFDGLGERRWERVAAIAEAEERNGAPISIDVVHEVFVRLSSECANWSPTDDGDDDPFQFLGTLDPARLRAVLLALDPAQIALIGVYRHSEDVFGLVEHLPAPFRKQVVLHLSRLERFPQEALKEAARNFSETFRAQLRQGSEQETKNAVESSLVVHPAREKALQILSEIDFTAESRLVVHLQGNGPDFENSIRKLVEVQALKSQLDAIRRNLEESSRPVVSGASVKSREEESAQPPEFNLEQLHRVGGDLRSS
jgi:hypothetical protein